MAYLIGTDEAGYAPNLGPLVISATVWQVPDELLHSDLYQVLRKVICREPPPARSRRVAWADSKALYKAGHGLSVLERGVLAALSLTSARPCNWHELWNLLDGVSAALLNELPWHDGYAVELPLETDCADLNKLHARLIGGFEAAGVRLLRIRSMAVFPQRFNELTCSYDNKAEALSRLTLNLVAEVMQELDEAPVLIYCDKHGGRSFYGPLLQQQFPDWLVEVHGESRGESIYRWGRPERRIEVRFCMNCERHLPAALASMASKYLREVSMRAFNDFWGARVPELRPTAGYPGDSKRFKNDIREVQTALGISDDVLWRSR